MQIVENWSDVHGEITKLEPSASDPSFCLATVKVGKAEPVGAFPNLLQNRAGDEIKVQVPRVAIKRATVASGDGIRLRVRQGGVDRFFSHPDHVEKLG